MKMKFCTTAMLLAVTAVCGAMAWAGPTLRVSSLGYDAADSTRFLQSALDAGSRRVIVDRQSGPWVTRPLFVTNSNVEVVFEDGVVVQAMRGQFHDPNDCLFHIGGGVSNVTLRGKGKVTLRMNKADYLDPKQNYVFSEWRMGVNILDARHVTLSNLTILSSGGDGVYVGGGARDVLLEDLTCDDHYRQGFSVTDACGLVVRRCTFTGTCGTAPQCGVDIEPNEWHDDARDILFEDCTFDGNAANGILHYFGLLTAKTRPVSIVYRRCVARSNKANGISLICGTPKNILEKGAVRGSIRFEDCEISANKAEALKIVNHVCDGLEMSFVRCVFDARGAGRYPAVSLSNAQLLRDFGGVRFDDCRIRLDDGRVPCAFEAREGIGIGGQMTGVLKLEGAAGPETLDMAAFAAQHVPHPERVSVFKTSQVDYRKLSPRSTGVLKGVRTPEMRGAFVFVQAVPAAGEYPIVFRSQKFSRASGVTHECVVQLYDSVGTDLGKFVVPEGEFTYRLKAQHANVYRLEVSQSRGTSTSVMTKTPGGGLLANLPIKFFHGRNETFYFTVPAKAREVLVEIDPEEPASVRLLDAAGKLCAELPYGTSPKTLKAVRLPTTTDEVWQLAFPKIDEDLAVQVGGDALPLISTERDGVLR